VRRLCAHQRKISLLENGIGEQFQFYDVGRRLAR
jgi:hypothetical protein